MVFTLFVTFLASFLISTTNATLVNITFDDSHSSWSWVGAKWNVITPQTPCSLCYAKPDPAKTFNSTWHDGNRLTGSFSFKGTAVYIYGIDAWDAGNITFTLSSPPTTSSHLNRLAAKGQYSYNALYFHASGLDPGLQTTVRWSLAGVGLFDYAIVTIEKPQDTTPPNTPSASRLTGTGHSSTFTSSESLTSQTEIILTTGTGLTHSDVTSASNPTATQDSDSLPSASIPVDADNSITTPASPKHHVGLILGCVSGTILVLSGAFVLWCLRRRRTISKSIRTEGSSPRPDAFLLGRSNVSTPTAPSAFGSKSSLLLSPSAPGDVLRSREADFEQRLRHLEAVTGAGAPPPEYGRIFGNDVLSR
ncbi:hypothetical protein C8F01DRAFT_776728 [Mycena amicta]|nr:hypothetical protein C8F01DRAFT_776728 [Mycena amicta]